MGIRHPPETPPREPGDSGRSHTGETVSFFGSKSFGFSAEPSEQTACPEADACPAFELLGLAGQRLHLP